MSRKVPGKDQPPSRPSAAALKAEDTANLQHQLRNLIAVVRSIAKRTAETSLTVEDYAMNLDGRLEAYSRTMTLLSRNAAEQVDLEFLLAEELLAALAHDGEKLKLSGPPVVLMSKAAETLGLAFHELATNAIKHGALANSGSIEIVWRVDDASAPHSLILTWTERGNRLMPVPSRRGFGISLLEETLPFELGAKVRLSFLNTGLICEIVIPISAKTLQLPDGH